LSATTQLIGFSSLLETASILWFRSDTFSSQPFEPGSAGVDVRSRVHR